MPIQVRKLIWEGTWCLVQEGLKSGFLHRNTAEVSCRKNVGPGHIDCGLAELCEMAKQFLAVNESDHQAVHVLDDETSIPEQDLLSCVTENSSNCAKIVVLMGQKYLVPPKSSFLLSDISCLQPLLNCKYLQALEFTTPLLPGKGNLMSSWLRIQWTGISIQHHTDMKRCSKLSKSYFWLCTIRWSFSKESWAVRSSCCGEIICLQVPLKISSTVFYIKPKIQQFVSMFWAAVRIEVM